MSTIIKRVPLELVISCPDYILKDVAARYLYANGQRTNQISGYGYRLVNTETYDVITVFVEHTTPVVTVDELHAANVDGRQIVVEVSGAVVTPYYSARTKAVEDSIKATGIKIIKG